jgi:hypothetical protein
MRFADGPITLLEPELYSWLVKRQLSHSSSDVIISCQLVGTNAFANFCILEEGRNHPRSTKSILMLLFHLDET